MNNVKLQSDVKIDALCKNLKILGDEKPSA